MTVDLRVAAGRRRGADRKIEEAHQAAGRRRRGNPATRRRHRDEVHARRARGAEDRDRGESQTGEADGDRVERDGAGGVDRRRAEPSLGGSECPQRHEGEIGAASAVPRPSQRPRHAPLHGLAKILATHRRPGHILRSSRHEKNSPANVGRALARRNTPSMATEGCLFFVSGVFGVGRQESALTEASRGRARASQPNTKATNAAGMRSCASRRGHEVATCHATS